MNWTCLVYGAPMLGALIWYFVSARKWFKGPKVNIEHMMLGREGNVVQGETKGLDSGSDVQPVEADSKVPVEVDSKTPVEVEGTGKPAELH
jgi:hypothetical protein